MVSEVSPDQLKLAVESQHGGTATFVQSVPVREMFRGQDAFSGNVAIFDLKDSPSGATRAYAWEQDRPDGKKRYAAVLHTGPITGPMEAVRAAIVAEARGRK
jgi:hypothetical protein